LGVLKSAYQTLDKENQELQSKTKECDALKAEVKRLLQTSKTKAVSVPTIPVESTPPNRPNRASGSHGVTPRSARIEPAPFITVHPTTTTTTTSYPEGNLKKEIRTTPKEKLVEKPTEPENEGSLEKKPRSPSGNSGNVRNDDIVILEPKQVQEEVRKPAPEKTQGDVHKSESEKSSTLWAENKKERGDRNSRRFSMGNSRISPAPTSLDVKVEETKNESTAEPEVTRPRIKNTKEASQRSLPRIIPPEEPVESEAKPENPQNPPPRPKAPPTEAASGGAGWGQPRPDRSKRSTIILGNKTEDS